MSPFSLSRRARLLLRPFFATRSTPKTSRRSAARRSPPRNAGEARRSHLESLLWRRILVAGLRLVPVPLQEATMPLWAALFYLQVPHIRRALLHNLDRLRRARPAGLAGPRPRSDTVGHVRSILWLERAAFRTFVNYCRCVARAYRQHVGGRLPACEIEGTEQLRRALQLGRGAVLVTGHLGNWQVGQHLLGRHGLPPVTVVMAEEPDRDAQRLEDRLRAGQVRVLYPSRSPLLGLELRGALQRGELVALQLDRPRPRARLRVPFVDGHAELASGPAELARACGAPVVPVFFPTVDGRVRVRVGAALEAPRDLDRRASVRWLTEQLAGVYEQQVLAHPDQWFNFFVFWCDDDDRGDADAD